MLTAIVFRLCVQIHVSDETLQKMIALHTAQEELIMNTKSNIKKEGNEK